MSFFVTTDPGRLTPGSVVAELVGPYLIITDALVWK